MGAACANTIKTGRTHIIKRERKGVNVIASAAGTMKALRDEVSDITYTPARASELDGKECGNGVVIAHDQGLKHNTAT